MQCLKLAKCIKKLCNRIPHGNHFSRHNDRKRLHRPPRGFLRLLWRNALLKVTCNVSRAQMRLSVNVENATLFKPTDPIPKQNLVHEKSTKSALPETMTVPRNFVLISSISAYDKGETQSVHRAPSGKTYYPGPAGKVWSLSLAKRGE